MPKEVSWEDAIQIVLRDSGGMMRYTDIADAISTRGLKKATNPSASVNAIIAKSLKEEDTPFIRLGRGEYTLKENISTSIQSQDADGLVKTDSEAGALQAFGMFWQRDRVIWSGKPKIMGIQNVGAENVNFSEQVGVYLLHDRDRVIYVGRASDTLFTRLKFHTTDRLSGRWDRFSWFGLRAVEADGSLSEPSTAWNYLVVIETLEALLIESLEPPLNRKRGDNFSGVEYIQVLDPEIERRMRKKLLADMADKI